MTTTLRKTAGLATLEQIDLTDNRRKMLDAAFRINLGPNIWQDRKATEAYKLLALSQLAGSERMRVLELDATTELRTRIWMKTPVSLGPADDGTLRTAGEAVLGLVYPHPILAMPLPGYAVASLIEPQCFYPNVGGAPGQRLCLGARIPKGTPLSECVLLCYGLLTMVTVMLDPDDQAGVMNTDAATWFQDHRSPRAPARSRSP